MFGFFHTLFLSIFVNCQQPAPTASLPFRNISAVGLCTLCFESSVGGIFFSANVNKIGRRMSSCDLNPAEVSLFGLTPIFGLTARLSPSLVSVCSCRTSPLIFFFWQTLLVPILELKRTRNGSFSLSKPSFNPGDMIFKERMLQTVDQKRGCLLFEYWPLSRLASSSSSRQF